MLTEINVEQIPQTKAAAIGLRTTFDQIGPAVGQAFKELYGHLAASEVEPAGPPATVYWEADRKRGITATVYVPVRDEVPAVGRIAMREFPAATAAVTLHRGPYEDLPTTYETVERFLSDHDLATGGPMREQYLNGPPDVPPDDYETRIIWPVVSEREMARVGGRNRFV